MRTLPAVCRLYFPQIALRSGFLIGFVIALAFPSALAATNAVSFVNTSLAPGFTLISNPLIAQDNRVAALFGGRQWPDGFRIFFMTNRQYENATFNTASGLFEPEALANRELLPGEGVFVYNPGSTLLTVTFAGAIPQGTFTNAIPAGFSIRSSSIPLQGTPDELSFPRAPGDTIYFFDAATQQFRPSTFDNIDNAWLPRVRSIATGEAFVIYKNTAAAWVQKLSISGFAGLTTTARTGESSDEAFGWSEFFAPFPLGSGDTVSMSLEIIPGGESMRAMQIALLAPSGETFLALDFQNGLVNGSVPYREGRWNEVAVFANLHSQTFDLTLNGSPAGAFPLGPAASLFAPSISELRLTMAGLPGVTTTAWIDTVRLTLQTVSLMEPISIDFDRTLPRSQANPGALRKEPRP